MITDEELQIDGWEPRSCLIGTLYFRGGYFLHLKDGKASVYSDNDDMNPIGTADTLDDIKSLEMKYDLLVISRILYNYKLAVECFKYKYGVDEVPIDVNLELPWLKD